MDVIRRSLAVRIDEGPWGGRLCPILALQPHYMSGIGRASGTFLHPTSLFRSIVLPSRLGGGQLALHTDVTHGRYSRDVMMEGKRKDADGSLYPIDIGPSQGKDGVERLLPRDIWHKIFKLLVQRRFPTAVSVRERQHTSSSNSRVEMAELTGELW